MIVELRDLIGRNCATRKEEKMPIYRVWVDGRAVGFLGWKPGAKLCLVEKFGPIELAEIESQVNELKGGHVQSVQAPDVPEEMLNPYLTDMEIDDDLTKAKFFEQTKLRIELVKDVPGFGDVWFRDVGEVQRSRRVSSLFDANGNRIPGASDRRRLNEILDQVCTDAKGTPMFTREDMPKMEQCGSLLLDPLYMALRVFNREDEEEKKSEVASSDSAES